MLTDTLVARCFSILGSAGRSIFTAVQEVVPGAERIEEDGLRLMYGGQDSPFTGAKVTDGRDEVDFARIETFFKGRATAWELTVGPWTSKQVLKQATEAGYVIEAFEGLLGQFPVGSQVDPQIQVDEVLGDKTEWARVGESGWTESETLPETLSSMGQIFSRVTSGRCFWAYSDGEPAATGALQVYPEGCLLAGASTRVQFRHRGLQQALIRRRLAAVPEGQLCIVGAVVGSTSYRNMQRHGFVPLFTELLLRRTN